MPGSTVAKSRNRKMTRSSNTKTALKRLLAPHHIAPESLSCKLASFFTFTKLAGTLQGTVPLINIYNQWIDSNKFALFATPVP